MKKNQPTNQLTNKKGYFERQKQNKDKQKTVNRIVFRMFRLPITTH